MEQKVWAKTLLNSYTCLERVASAIDKMVLDKGINSAFDNRSTLRQTDRIIRLIQRKKMLINAKIIVENSICKLRDNELNVIVLRYFDKVKCTDIAELLDVSMRTYFRRLSQAINNMAKILNNQGFTGEVLFSMLGDDPWISRLYDAIYNKEINAKRENFEEDFSELNLLNMAYSSYKNEKINNFASFTMC